MQFELWGGQSCPQAGFPAGWTRSKAGPQPERLPHVAGRLMKRISDLRFETRVLLGFGIEWAGDYFVGGGADCVVRQGMAGAGAAGHLRTHQLH
jgi:hypothetical protein